MGGGSRAVVADGDCPAGMIWSSAHQALKAVEASVQDHVIGTGLNHVVSKQHLNLRTSAFEYFHQQHASLLHSTSVNALIPALTTPYVFSLQLVAHERLIQFIFYHYQLYMQ